MDFKNKIYFENLDALRFLAFLSVFVNHLFFSNNVIISPTVIVWHEYLAPYAYLGVSFFFTLSGFIITWVILHEYDVSGKFKLKNFYTRRALRIWPLYFLIVGMAYIIVPFISEQLKLSPPNLPNIWWCLTFTINYYVGCINPNILFFLAFLWSVAVEEQFYIVWGLLMRFFYNYFQLIVILLLIVYLIFMGLVANNIIDSVYFNTLYYLPNFVFGSYLAYSCFHKNRLFNLLQTFPKLFWMLFYVLFIVALLFIDIGGETVFVDTIKHIVFTLFFCLLLYDQCFNESPLFKMGKYKAINKLGKMSFGLYCWHGVVITVVMKISQITNYNENYWDVFLIFPTIILTSTILISKLSYDFFEVKFLKLKHYF